MSSAPRCYREFWPYYVRAHTRLATQRSHLAATLLGSACSITGMIQGEITLFFLGVVVAYVIAVPSHFIFEGNRPTMTQHPFWSAIADLHMCALLLTGRMGREVARYGAVKPRDALAFTT